MARRGDEAPVALAARARARRGDAVLLDARERQQCGGSRARGREVEVVGAEQEGERARRRRVERGRDCSSRARGREVEVVGAEREGERAMGSGGGVRREVGVGVVE